MSLSVVRYIELLSVNDTNKSTSLQLIVHIDEAIEVSMDVDSFTFLNLQAQCTFDDHYKYRLSLRAIEDVFSNRIYSTITKTFLTRSERIDFDVSPLYKKQIAQLKNCISVEQLLALPFISPIHIDEDFQANDSVIEDVNDEQETTVGLEVEAAPVHNRLDKTVELNSDTIQDLKDKHEQPSTTECNDVNDDEIKASVVDELLEADKEQEHVNEDTQITTATFDKNELSLKINKSKKDKQTLPENPFKSPIILIATIFIVVAAILAGIQLIPSDNRQAARVPVAETANYVNMYEKETFEIKDAYTFGLPVDYVAITFTKGPSPYTEEIITILEQQQIGATFFLIGKHVSQFADKVTLLHDKGFSIGHATETYTLLTTMSKEQQLFAIESTAQKIEQITGERVDLFRPPYGLFNGATQEIMKEERINVIDWTIDPYDVKAQVASDIVQYVEQQPLKGSILNLHESSAAVEALPKIIELLKQQNLKIVMLK